MAETSDIAIIGLVALMLSEKLGGLNLGGLLGGGTPADPKVEVSTTESITCTCADGFQMQSDSGDCIQSCEGAGHGTKTTIIEGETTVREKETVIVHDPVITNISMTTTCPDGEVIDLTNVASDEWAQVITNRCGYDCPEPYVFKKIQQGVNYRQYQKFIYHLHQPTPALNMKKYQGVRHGVILLNFKRCKLPHFWKMKLKLRHIHHLQ